MSVQTPADDCLARAAQHVADARASIAPTLIRTTAGGDVVVPIWCSTEQDLTMALDALG